MPLAPVPGLLGDALRRGYAVGFFESWDLASLQGVIDAAEESRSPVFVGFNGEFLFRPQRRAAERIEWYAALGRAAAHTAAVPCGLLFNECPWEAWVRRAVESGFNAVMPTGAQAGAESYAARVAETVRFAHARGAAVEAELGTLPCDGHGLAAAAGAPTDPEAAARFAGETGIDALAVSVGNVHILLRGERELDLERLKAIRARVERPLVLHGGTGIAAESLRRAVGLGVAKVNFGTYLKQRCLDALRKALGGASSDPHGLLGYGGDEDLLVLVRRTMREAVLERMELLGCMGKA